MRIALNLNYSTHACTLINGYIFEYLHEVVMHDGMVVQIRLATLIDHVMMLT